MRWVGKLFGPRVPGEFAGVLAADEDVVGSAATASGAHLAVTALGLWVPGSDGPRRIGWHLIAKAVWSGEALTVTEAEETAHAGAAVLLADRSPARFSLPSPGKVPQQVRERVDGSIRSRYYKELRGGGAWFVVRKVPGQDGSVLQVRPDRGADRELVADMAREAAEKLAGPAS